jgi:hypothetical protein
VLQRGVIAWNIRSYNAHPIEPLPAPLQLLWNCICSGYHRPKAALHESSDEVANALNSNAILNNGSEALRACVCGSAAVLAVLAAMP